MATGIAMQGLSAAIVYTAIDRITKMIADAESRLSTKVDPAINRVIRNISLKPDEVQALYSNSRAQAAGALSSATIVGQGPSVSAVPALVEKAVASFFDGYTGVMDDLFPGLFDAGESADRFVRGALESAVGVSYSEQVDSTAPDTVFALARKQAHQQERDTLDLTAAAGHRFAPGVAINAIARIHAESTQGAAEAIVAAHAARTEQERLDKMRLVRAEIGQRMDRVKQLQSKVAEAFRMKMQAQGLWVNDQNAVIDAWNGQYAMSAQFQSRVTQLLREAAGRRHASVVGGHQVSDRAIDIGKLRMSNGQEIVDLLGNMIATLQNQIRANGSYSGSERDVTDWDAVLSPG